MSLTGAAQHLVGEPHKAKQDTQPQQGVTAPPIVEPAAASADRKPDQPQCRDDRGAGKDCTVVATNAALEQVRDADWQAWTGVAGVFVGLFTLGAACVAAFYAKRAAEETEKGAKAAKVSADAFVKVEDASLVVSFPETVEVTGTIHIYKPRVRIINVGRSAALVHLLQLGTGDLNHIDEIISPRETKLYMHVGEVNADSSPTPFGGYIAYSTALSESARLNFYGIIATPVLGRKTVATVVRTERG